MLMAIALLPLLQGILMLADENQATVARDGGMMLGLAALVSVSFVFGSKLLLDHGTRVPHTQSARTREQRDAVKGWLRKTYGYSNMLSRSLNYRST